MEFQSTFIKKVLTQEIEKHDLEVCSLGVVFVFFFWFSGGGSGIFLQFVVL